MWLLFRRLNKYEENDKLSQLKSIWDKYDKNVICKENSESKTKF